MSETDTDAEATSADADDEAEVDDETGAGDGERGESSFGSLPAGYSDDIDRTDREIEELRQEHRGELFYDVFDDGGRQETTDTPLSMLHPRVLQGRVTDRSGATITETVATTDTEACIGAVRVRASRPTGRPGIVSVDLDVLDTSDETAGGVLPGTSALSSIMELRADETRRLIEGLVTAHNQIADDVAVEVTIDEVDEPADDEGDYDPEDVSIALQLLRDAATP